MSALTEAFDEALDAAAEAKGSRETVTFQGGTKDAIFLTDPLDLGPGAGGDVEHGQIIISLKLSDVTLPIAQLAPITYRGRERNVLSYFPAEGRVDLTVGDPAEEQE